MSEPIPLEKTSCPNCGDESCFFPGEAAAFCSCGTLFDQQTKEVIWKTEVVGDSPFAGVRGARMQPADDNDRTTNQYAQTDIINHPEHYAGSIECIDAMIAAYGKEQVAIFCKLCAFKYLWRLEKKGDCKVDAGKAQWYLDKYKEMKR